MGGGDDRSGSAPLDGEPSEPLECDDFGCVFIQIYPEEYKCYCCGLDRDSLAAEEAEKPKKERVKRD
jgi:hypothetical protein